MRFLKIDWKEIRAINGSQQNGFEELCYQIAGLEVPLGANFERNGTPDGGIECYAVLPNSSEWGWQAKYFVTPLGKSQWSQIDDSVKTALDKHPQLVRYFICLPQNLSDGRIPGQQSARDKWDNHVKKWTNWASNRGMSVEFVYWGSSKLLSLLTDHKQLGRLRFWFDVRIFDKRWFEEQFEKSKKAAGPRYTPEIDVELPIAADFEAFGRTVHFFDGIKAYARGIRDKLRSLRYKDSESTVEIPDILSLISQITTLTEQILSELSSINVQPVGELPFQKIYSQVTTANAVTEKLDKLLYECERDYDTKQPNLKDGKRQSTYKINPFQEQRYRLIALQRELWDLSESLEKTSKLASSNILILTGDAGTGKTHLLCDITDRRIKEGYPTVLLMGHLLISESEPWTQVLQQLDLRDLSVEEFVYTLEAAAQTAGCRALLIIDALNEGAGRLIWPDHIAPFLAILERSPWIGVIFSVRSSYEQLIVSEEVRERAARVKHYGFADHEYDATRTFFSHYKLELPSTPLLAPEFRNPLFLKTLCRSLEETGNRRLPRGFHGITAIFELFLDAINSKLSRELRFYSKIPLVRQAIDAFTKELINTGESWLPLVKAKGIINKLLPGRDCDHYQSLYHGLVSEGILIEEVAWRQSESPEYVVLIAYERFADHLIASSLLKTYMDIESPETAFAKGAPLYFLCDPHEDITLGLLEAFCLQIPEFTGKELIEIVPEVENRWNISEAFRQSLIWRDQEAFSDSTRKCLNKLIRTEYDFSETLNVLLTVATLPKHPLNSIFLDQRLRENSMPNRDAWWSIYLHKAWKTHGAVDRLVYWASNVKSQDIIDNDTVDLCSTALAWMLTTSNRFLRDRATKALVNLLTGRLDAVVRLVERFSDVDDLYVTERVYAVAYGVAMQSFDSEKVGSLALCVYNQVFEAGIPPVHILLRDYARGVVERALYLGANIDINEDNIRPPYRSSWPAISTEDDIKPLLPNWSRGSHDSRDLEWARNRIGGSVMDDDFARYVIGTDRSHKDFLSLKLGEPSWQSPNERLAVLITQLSDREKEAWIAFDEADKEIENNLLPFLIKEMLYVSDFSEDGDLESINGLTNNLEESHQSEIEVLQHKRDTALETLKASLTEEHGLQIEEILEARNNKMLEPPYFDYSLIQRYILWRVFDLGWTVKRFGHFDRFIIGFHGRDASKAERIGKKYQWIAYHEIMALIADNFQYCGDKYRGDYGKKYNGPWQTGPRDIDPSCTRIAVKTREPWSGHSPSWWSSVKYEKWNTSQDKLEWTKLCDDLPQIENLLSVECPKDGSRWLNLQGFFNWKQLSPVDKDPIDVERRELWYRCIGYLIRDSDVKAFMGWAENEDFSRGILPQSSEAYGMFLGEYGWSPAWRDFHEEYLDEEEWILLDKDCPVRVQILTSEYHCPSSVFDCSVDDNYSLTLPADNIVSFLGLRWSGYGSDFLDETGQIVAFDPTAHTEGPPALLLRQDKLKEFLTREKLVLCWVVTGEKLVHGSGFTFISALRMSGAYMLGTESITGFLKCFFENRDDENNERSDVLLATLKTSLNKQTT